MVNISPTEGGIVLAADPAVTQDFIILRVGKLWVTITNGKHQGGLTYEAPGDMMLNVALPRHEGVGEFPKGCLQTIEVSDILQDMYHTVEDALKAAKGEW